MRLRLHYLARFAQTLDYPDGATGDHLAGFLAHPGWSPETRKSARASLRVFYRWLHETGRIDVDPSARLPRVRVPAGSPRPAPESVVTAALNKAEPRDRLMVLLAVLAGLRRVEIAQVHTRDIETDLVGYSLRVHGKGGRVRVVPLVAGLAEALLIYPEGYVFPGKIDGHLSPDRVGRILRGLLGSEWTGHTLRHRFASSAYAAQRDLLAVQTLLGHSQPETTARYVRLPDDALRAAVGGAAANLAA